MCDANKVLKPGYELEKGSQFIYARFYGVWDTCIDLEFMTALAATMQSMKSHRWVLIVDMREWTLPEAVIEQMQGAKVTLDRRNQIAECWLVSNDQQGAFLLPLLAQYPFEFARFREPVEVQQFLQRFSITCPYIT